MEPFIYFIKYLISFELKFNLIMICYNKGNVFKIYIYIYKLLYLKYI